MQYVDQDRAAPLIIAVYTGADGTFLLYEDGRHQRTVKAGPLRPHPIRDDDRTGTVTLGAREEKRRAAMPTSRTIRVRWMRAGNRVTDANAFDTEVTYAGTAVRIPRQ